MRRGSFQLLTTSPGPNTQRRLSVINLQQDLAGEIGLHSRWIWPLEYGSDALLRYGNEAAY
jgi:hypothetical protein